jgi:outer membrane receptor protein involved in Fe transport
LPGRNSVVFRGVSTGTQEFYTESQVAIYFDETPLTFNSQQLWPEMVDMERIESLPGPQGTLFGSASQTGTLRMISNKPNHDGVSGQAFVSFMGTKGGDPGYTINGHVNIPLIENTLAMRLVAYHRDEGGWIDNIYGKTYVPIDPGFVSPDDNEAIVEDDQNTYKLSGGRISVLWDINEDWQTIVGGVYQEDDNQGHWGWDPYLGENKVTRFFKDYRQDEWWIASLLITGDLGFATLTSSTTYLERDINYEWDNANYEQGKDATSGQYYALYNSNYTWGTTFNFQPQDRFSQEIRLTSQGDSKFQWMIGGFYEDIYNEWYYGSSNPDFPETTAFYYSNNLRWWYNYYADYYDFYVEYPLPETNVGYSEHLKNDVTQLAIFGEISYALTDRWSVTGGARWFEFELDAWTRYQFPEGIPAWNAELGMFDWKLDSTTMSTSKNSDTVYKLSTTYNISDDKMVYALFSQGFRPGGLNSQRAANTGQIPLEYSPDFLDNYEIGIKSDWLDGRLRVNVTAFLMKWEDYQQTEFELGGTWWIQGNINGNEVEQKGIELDTTWRATDNLVLTATLFFGDSEATEDFTFPSGDVLKKGDELANSPKQRYHFAVDYTLPWQPFGGQLWTRFDYSYGSQNWENIAASYNKSWNELLPSWHRANLQVGLNLPSDWEITFVVNNLFDDEIVSQIYSGSNDESDFFGDPRWRDMPVTQRPRSMGFNVRKHWR